MTEPARIVVVVRLARPEQGRLLCEGDARAAQGVRLSRRPRANRLLRRSSTDTTALPVGASEVIRPRRLPNI